MDSSVVEEKQPSTSKRRKENILESENSDNSKNEVITKVDVKRKSDETEDAKPRIVLTFRTEKAGMKNSNMKIVSTEEKHDELSPRRLTRARVVDSEIHDDNEGNDNSLSPQKGKESDEQTSDSPTSALKRSTRRRSKEYSDSILATAIARKERYYETPQANLPVQRLSRRIKPTAKILANKELRTGLETQNNVRLGITTTSEKEEGGIKTRRSARHKSVDEKSTKLETDIAMSAKNVSPNQSSDSVQGKRTHLNTLGLKEVEIQDELAEEMSINMETQADNTIEVKESASIVLEENEEVEEIMGEEADSDADSDVNSEIFNYQSAASSDGTGDDCASDGNVRRSSRKGSAKKKKSHHGKRSRRSRQTKLTEKEMYSNEEQIDDANESDPENSDDSYEETDNMKQDHDSMEYEDDANDVTKESRRRSLRKRRRICYESDEYQTLVPPSLETSRPASADEGSEATCPEDETRVIATCYCETPSNVKAVALSLKEPVFCRAVETLDDMRVGCSHRARQEEDGSYAPLLRAGPRAPYVLLCDLHTRQLRTHMCCSACGIFCTQGTFYQCSEKHLFHKECGLPYGGSKMPPGCPHCGLYSYHWQPCNRNCYKVQVDMKCSNKRIYLPDQRDQHAQAYLSFPALDADKLELEPIIPEDLLPNSQIDLKVLCNRTVCSDKEDLISTGELCDAIVNRAKTEDLISKMMSGVDIHKALDEVDGGTFMHLAARYGNLSAMYLLHYAGANLDVTDASLKTPLMLAVIALVDKSQNKLIKNTNIDEVKPKSEEVTDDGVIEIDKLDRLKELHKNDEDLLKVIRYLVTAGCDVNFQGAEGMTALHFAAQHGNLATCNVLLSARHVSVDAVDHGGWTPLVYAAEHGHVDVVKVLLNAEAAVSATDAEGNAVLHWAALAGYAAVVCALVGAAPHALNVLNTNGDTPLHIAARQGHYPCVVILLARGARTDIKNASGSLASEVCSGDCQTAISLNMQVALSAGGGLAKHRIVCSDISKGREHFPIPCVNEVDDCPAPDDFVYVTSHVTPQHVRIDNTIANIQGCECAEADCSAASCACAVLGVRRWYTQGRLISAFPFHEPPMLFECNYTCGCDQKQCSNSVVTRLHSLGSMFVRSQVYRVGGGCGWGLRSGTRVLRGTPVALYCGELLPSAVADCRTQDQYMFSLELKPDLIEQCEDRTQLCVDAAQFGSAARFINHSCRPNLAPVRVFTQTRDLRLPHIVLFSTRDIAPLEQFTFDYGDKFWSVKSKIIKCECGSLYCRYSGKSK